MFQFKYFFIFKEQLMSSQSPPSWSVLIQIPSNEDLSFSDLTFSGWLLRKLPSINLSASSPKTPSPFSHHHNNNHKPSCKCGVSSRIHRKIVGCEPTKKNEFPWQLALVRKIKFRPFCSGTLLSSNTVLTAEVIMTQQSEIGR